MDIWRDFEKISLKTEGQQDPDHFEGDVKVESTLDHLEISKFPAKQKVSNDELISQKTDAIPNNHEKSTEYKDYIQYQMYSKDIILNHFRRNRLICRFCPNRLSPSKYCQKHKLCRLKGSSYRCKFCGEHFEFKSILVAHVRASHSKMIALEHVMKRAVKRMLPNTPVFQNVLRKYSKIR